MTRNLTTTIGLFVLVVVVSQSCLLDAATSVPGAIFTTVADGTIVDANTQYTSKCAVYLDGGPGPKAPAGAAGLPSGDYFFQVTDPSGKTLLSTDVVNNRRFHVSTDGVITAYTGTGGPVHPIGIDQVHSELGAITISLANTSCPTDYLDTPNSGGVYKAWVTPVADLLGDPTQVDNACGNGCFHGFASSTSKTDNFKVQPNIPTFCLSVSISPDFGSPITLTDPLGVTNTYLTSTTDGTVPICSLVAGSYTVTERSTGFVVGLTVNGTSLPAQPTYSFSWTAREPTPTVAFQNAVPF